LDAVDVLPELLLFVVRDSMSSVIFMPFASPNKCSVCSETVSGVDCPAASDTEAAKICGWIAAKAVSVLFTYDTYADEMEEGDDNRAEERVEIGVSSALARSSNVVLSTAVVVD
jgi:hypothetical protein